MKKTIMANTYFSLIFFCVLEAISLCLLIHSFLYYSHVLWTLFLMISCLFLLLIILFSWQTITLTYEGFTIKCAFFVIVKASWQQIARIDIIELDSLYSPYGKVKLNWIVFFTDPSQKITDGGANSKNAPWMVKATRQNIRVIKKYAPVKIVSF